MKLLTKTTLYFVTVSLVVFFAGGVGLYKIMQNLVEREVDADLYSRIHYLFDNIRQLDSLQNVAFIATEPIDIEKVKKPAPTTYRLQDTVLYNKNIKAYMPYRQLSTVVKSGKNYYRIRIYKSLITSNYLIEKIALIITLMLILFLILAYFLNRYIFGKVWADFFDTLHIMQSFRLDNPHSETFQTSEIIEFNQLNRELERMTEKIIRDYEAVKEFTGNLSHEVQTPLSVIKNKTELLFQESLNEKQYELAGSIYSAVIRLSGIVRSLGLIARIEKNQFVDKTAIDFKALIQKQVDDFQPLMDSRRVKPEVHFDGSPKVVMDKDLADILVRNLVKNAVKHNVENGFVRIWLTEKKFVIENSGQDPGMPTEELFEQFSRASDQGFMGIGLAIVKKIIEHYHWSIQYHFKDEVHRIVVNF
ncbi:HAMP domain-containing histidine kinase [Candidatus Sulfidibacterium hydrothermale]|uniref:sensor histidine kinase n=1 Tax=Candidatus Sulfidibacterium hydrothermale TaxID=2875962 RepID=UPI001F0AB5F0|nr:HAMP domain-containing sensor histidine kinase [Candidatus Sulfidibacterium hydrothermale]UBM61960.1 HAMP domain-containing histidine kinase [Candidatus Sulfidibacterium hydrothermale]